MFGEKIKQILSGLGNFAKQRVEKSKNSEAGQGLANGLNYFFGSAQNAPQATPTPTARLTVAPTAMPTARPTAMPTPSQAPKALNLGSMFHNILGSQTQTKPSPTPTAIPKPLLPITIKVPSRGGGEITLPQEASNALFQAFDKYGEATNAAQVLHHPMQVSGTPNEIAQGKNAFGNTGENPDFRFDAENKNKDGSLDKGLMQINNTTFNDMMNSDYWRRALARRGVTSFSDMSDPYKNAMTGMLILMRKNFDPETGSMKPGKRNYQPWYAAPATNRWD